MDFYFHNWITSVEGVEGLFKTSFFNFKIEAVEKAISWFKLFTVYIHQNNMPTLPVINFCAVLSLEFLGGVLGRL